MSPVKRLILLTAVVLTSACTTQHDKRIAAIEPGMTCSLEDAVFDNTPYYLSETKSDAPIGKLSRLFGSYDKAITRVHIARHDSDLSARFYDADGKEIRQDNASQSRPYAFDGKRFIINKGSSCKPGEAGVGCTWSQVELSCTRDNDLVVKEVNGGAALIALVIPLGARSSYLGLYKRVPDGSARPTIAVDAPQAAHP